MKSISATEFEANCLAILDEVHQTGEGVAVFKRSTLVAQIVPPPREQVAEFPQFSLSGKGRSRGDLFSAVPPESWEVEKKL